MKKNTLRLAGTARFISIFALLLLNFSCQKNLDKNADPKSSASTLSSKNEKDPKALKDFTQVNLVGDNMEYNPARVDPLLVNAWGLTFSTGGTAWLSAEATGKSAVYNKDGGQVLSAVSIPSPTSATGGHPTGIVFSGSATDFKLLNGNPARFIFAGDDGVISGWNGGTAAVRMVNNSATAAYLGLALASDAGNNFLYAANFEQGKIDVFDKTFTAVNKTFTDPNLPAGYSPFNIQAIDNKLYVMYAKVGAGGDEIHHPGFGLVDIYNPDGSLVTRFISNGQLNSPWGIAKAPAGFYGSGSESLGNTYLVGNFGDGHINAYSSDGTFLGQLREHGKPIDIEGLWAISFAPVTATLIDPNRLYFTAGPDDETHGLFGYIVK
ncbi:MAG: TIGR03118 family protein [Chitinophagaceae bacterium]|nr:TIGR03118 family protein [Chitinophagaceae bacterium]